MSAPDPAPQPLSLEEPTPSLASLMAAAQGAALAASAPPELRALGALLDRVSASSAAEYARDVRDFALWCHARGRHVFQVDRPLVERWKRSCEEQQFKPRTLRRRLAAIQGFYLEAHDLGMVGQVPTLRVKRPRVDEDQRLGIDLQQARRLLAAGAASGARDEGLVCLLLLNGLRASEVSGLAVADLDQTRGHRVLTVLRKGGKVRRAALAPRTARALDAHLTERGPLSAKAPLLAGGEGGSLSRHGVARVTHRLGRRAGLGRLNPHELRHAFITLGLDAGVTLRDLQEAAGHSDPKTTIAYDRGRHALDRHPTYALAQYLG